MQIFYAEEVYFRLQLEMQAYLSLRAKKACKLLINWQQQIFVLKMKPACAVGGTFR